VTESPVGADAAVAAVLLVTVTRRDVRDELHLLRSPPGASSVLIFEVEE
jgi:CBS-domain-containing membrane protein